MRESPGGLGYYMMLHARNLGRAYTSAVLDAYRSDAISSLDVAIYVTEPWAAAVERSAGGTA